MTLDMYTALDKPRGARHIRAGIVGALPSLICASGVRFQA